ncbi:hypothetical protein [Sorangium cellulosum]|uniref:hypothetical protein n=1 Tax=Sorangium cellulosum TaxID=56 RepID=UPI0013319388|nr:hypothetical protein [Sorangium cellulosum]
MHDSIRFSVDTSDKDDQYETIMITYRPAIRSSGASQVFLAGARRALSGSPRGAGRLAANASVAGISGIADVTRITRVAGIAGCHQAGVQARASAVF